jgi:hypothetical protein
MDNQEDVQVGKKTYLLVLLIILTAGCSGNLNSINSGSVSESLINIPNADFSFSGLRLNLALINEIGVYQNQTRQFARRASSSITSTTQNDTYLVGYGAEGQAVPLDYLNSQNQEVQVPFSVFSFEVVGDFSYIVYYNSHLDYALESLKDAITQSWEFNSHATKSLGSTQFEVLLKQNGTNNVGGIQAYIILHNKSGKLFDAVDALGLENYLDGNLYQTVSLKLFTAFQDKIIYFARRKSTCKGELVFNELENTLRKTEVCTSLDINPLFVHSTGYFSYTFNDMVSYASPDFSITGNLTSYFLTSIPVRNMVFKSVDQNIVLISGKLSSSFVVFDGTFSLLEEKNQVLDGGNQLSSFAWLFNKGGYDYFSINPTNVSVIYYVNFQTFSFEKLIEESTNFPPLNQYDSRHKYIVYEGSLYQLGRYIRLLGEDNYFSILEQNVYEVTNNIAAMIKTGYVDYIQTQGLSQISKSLNLQTGEIYLQSESRPIITVTQVQPIN